MKKSILMLGVIFCLHMESKAQQEEHFIAINSFHANIPVSFSTQAYNGPGKDADFFLRRSKNYRIVGWSTLGVGLVASGAGLLVANNAGNNVIGDSNDDAAVALFLVGAVSGITSIPFMIMASSYKRKAKAMVSSQKTGLGVPANVSKDIVGITLQIPLGK